MRTLILGGAAALLFVASGAEAATLFTASSTAPGGPVKAYSTPDLNVTHDFTPFGGGAGASVGAALNGDGSVTLVVGAGPGAGPHVRVFNGATGSELHSFFAFAPGFQGGVRVAAGDVNGDGTADIVVGAGAGGGPHVRVVDGVTGGELHSFFAFDTNFTGGVSVAAGDVNNDGTADIVVGAGAGGGPHVKVFDGVTGGELHSFFAFDPGFSGGVNVAVGHRAQGDTIIVGTASGAGHVNVFDPFGGGVIDSFFAFGANYTGGVSVAGGSFGTLDSLFVGQLDGGLVNVYGADRRGDPLSFRAFPDGGVNVAGVFAAVPEPQAWALLILGFFGAGGALRARYRANRFCSPGAP